MAFDGDIHLRITMLRNFDGAINDGADAHGLQFETRRTSEIEEARDQSVEAIDFSRNVARKLRGGGLGGTEFLLEHFGGAFDNAERIANFMGEAGRELAESGEALRAANFSLSVLELAIGFGERLGKSLIASHLAANFHGESIDEHRQYKQEEDTNSQDAITAGRDFVI